SLRSSGLQPAEPQARNHPMPTAFETALHERVDGMLDACTQCGKCVEACPVTTPGGVTAEPKQVIGGIIDILRGGDGNESAKAWTKACVMSGDCVRACDYGVNPRFLVAVGRATVAQRTTPMADLRK